MALLYSKEPALQHDSNKAICKLIRGCELEISSPNQTVNFWHFSEDILAPRPRINLSIASLESCCKAGSFEYNKPYI